MIEYAEFATPTQRKLHDHYLGIHRKFFPALAPVPPKPEAAEPVEVVPVPEEIPKPSPAKFVPQDSTNLRLRMIRRTVCEFYNITEVGLKSARRTSEFVRPRHMFSYLASQFTNASLPHIGKTLGGQDHTTILHAIRRTKMRIRLEKETAEQAVRLASKLRQQFGETNRLRNCVGRYVPHDRVHEYLLLGWMWAANLNEYAALMIWPCGCECVEPKG